MAFLMTSLHALAAVVWVGGMVFSYGVLRPALAPLETGERLRLWSRVFPVFFAWVWASIIILLATGYGLVFMVFGGFAGAGMHVHVMQLTGLLMMALFAHMFFAPYKRLRRSLEADDMEAAGAALAGMRRIFLINSVLGVFTVLIGAGGRYW